MELAVAELPDLSDHAIAQACKVSQPFVSRLRKHLKTVISSEKRTGRDGKARKLPVRKALKTAAAPATTTASSSPESSTTKENTAPTIHNKPHEQPQQGGEAQQSVAVPFAELRQIVTNQLDHAHAVCPRERQADLYRHVAGYLKEKWPEYSFQRGVALARPTMKANVSAYYLGRGAL